MNVGATFLVFLVVTLALLALAVVTGRRAFRRRHLTCVVLAFASLGATIYFAEKLGHGYDLESAGDLYTFHLTIAKTTVAIYLLPLVTGIATLRRPRWRKLHGKVAWIVILATLVTAVSGAAMVLSAEPKL